MIELKELTKVYKTSRKTSTIAVDHLNLKLPNTGMVFVVGKSGSGKSTLLNMLGTLDNITSGDIIVDGKSLASANDAFLQEYRSSYLGFIFQDFLLLNEFTVRENIELALNISGIDDLSLVDKTLEKVDLVNEANKFPTELSGGQRQRVAIGRALVKNPKMLLCDEPTGNLDFKTSATLLKFLKEQSKEKLVVIVSHNLEDAEIYADRIIELFDGKVVSDTVKNLEYVNNYEEHDDYVVLPHHKDMTNKEVESLNNLVKEKKIKIKQNRGGFIPIEECDYEQNEFKLSSSHLSKENTRKLSSMFFRKNKHGVPYTIIMLTLFISLLYIFQVFVLFDGNSSMKMPTDEEALRVGKMAEQTIQGTLSTSYIYGITDDEINKYYEAGYTGNIYEAYSYGFSMGMSYLSTNRVTRFQLLMDYNLCKETTGTLCCNEEFLINLYGIDGKIDVICGNIEDANKKIIITDYTADCLINYREGSLVTYEDVLNKYKNRICAIINTNYKTRYQEVLKHGEDAKSKDKSSADYISMYHEDEQHLKFIQEVQDYLTLNYAFCSKDEFIDNVFVASTQSFSLCNFYGENEEGTKNFVESMCYFSYDSKNSYKLKDDEIILSFGLYKALFGKEYTALTASTFVPHKVKFTRYSDFTDDSTLTFEKEYTIKKVAASSYLNKQGFKELEKARIVPYSLYFDNTSQKEIVYDVSNQNDFLIYTIDTSIVPVINTIIELFRGFCYLIIILLIIVCIVYLISYGIGSIKRNLYEIGVLKALGTKNIDISKIFIFQIIAVGLGVILIAIVGIEVFSSISNKILISAFEDFMTIKIFTLKVIPVKPKIMTFDLIIVFVVTLTSSIIPLIYLKALKPLNILKGKKK